MPLKTSGVFEALSVSSPTCSLGRAVLTEKRKRKKRKISPFSWSAAKTPSSRWYVTPCIITIQAMYGMLYRILNTKGENIRNSRWGNFNAGYCIHTHNTQYHYRVTVWFTYQNVHQWYNTFAISPTFPSTRKFLGRHSRFRLITISPDFMTSNKIRK